MIEHITCLPGDEAYTSFTEVIQAVYPAETVRYKMTAIPVEHLLVCVVVYRDEKPVARTALYNNPYLKYGGQDILLAGGFESINDEEVVKYLFLVAEQIALQHHKKFIIGPMNGSTWEDYRLPLSSDHRWFFTETIYPDYYAELFRQAGFDIFHKYYSSASGITPGNKALPSYPGIRNLSLKNFEQELPGLYDLCMMAFTDNSFFSPIDKEHFIAKYLQVENYIDEELVLIIENEETNKLEAFVFCLPDILDATGSTLIIKTIAKDPQSKKTALVTVLLEEIYNRACRKGYTTMIHAFMHEQNRSNKLSTSFGGEVFREYALFIKPVSNAIPSA